ncbi:hypothetical protein NECID01_0963 [Nematocida sp. AWRm77]|nr:hypothetical protein NECID01_0963 [Nematocida sp. AWRm77]
MKKERPSESKRVEYLEKLQREERKNIKAYYKQYILDSIRRKYSDLWSTDSAYKDRMVNISPQAEPSSVQKDLLLVTPSSVHLGQEEHQEENKEQKDSSEN